MSVNIIKPLLPIIIVGLLVCFLSLFIWVSVNNGQQVTFFGMVSEVATSTIQITDRNNAITQIVLTPVTRISHRKENVKPSDIHVGHFVHITGMPHKPGVIEARSIKILRSPNKNRSYGEDR